MEKYYAIRGFLKNDPIIIVKLNEETQTINSVFLLNGNTLSRHEITNQIFVNEITQIPELEEYLLVDKKNRDRILEKLESIYNRLQKKIGETAETYALTKKEYSNVEDQILDAIEFLKTKGMTLSEKIDYKKFELLDIENKLKTIHEKKKIRLSKSCIVSIVIAIVTVFSIRELIEKLPYILQVLSSTLIATTPFVISTLYVQNKEKDESKTLIEQYDLAESYLKQYKKKHQEKEKLIKRIKTEKQNNTKPHQELPQLSLNNLKRFLDWLTTQPEYMKQHNQGNPWPDSIETRKKVPATYTKTKKPPQRNGTWKIG